MLEVKNLNKSYRKRRQDLSCAAGCNFRVEKGGIRGGDGTFRQRQDHTAQLHFLLYPRGQRADPSLGTDLSALDERQLARVRNENLGFVFQDFMLLDGLTVLENICMPQIIAIKPVWLRWKRKLKKLCRLFGIDKIMKSIPLEISGGEKQRTAVARSLMNNPTSFSQTSLRKSGQQILYRQSSKRFSGREGKRWALRFLCDPRQLCRFLLRQSYLAERRNDLSGD